MSPGPCGPAHRTLSIACTAPSARDESTTGAVVAGVRRACSPDTFAAGDQRVQAAHHLSGVPERRTAANVPRRVRVPGAAARALHAPLRPGHHRAAGVPVRPVPGQPPGRAARGHRVQPDADVVPGLVRQPVQPVVPDHVKLAVPAARDVRAPPAEPRRLRRHARVLQVRGPHGHGHGRPVLRARPPGRGDRTPQRVHGVPQHPFPLRHGQAAGHQLQGDRRHTSQTAQTVAHSKRREVIIIIKKQSVPTDKKNHRSVTHYNVQLGTQVLVNGTRFGRLCRRTFYRETETIGYGDSVNDYCELAASFRETNQTRSFGSRTRLTLHPYIIESKCFTSIRFQWKPL